MRNRLGLLHLVTLGAGPGGRGGADTGVGGFGAGPSGRGRVDTGGGRGARGGPGGRGGARS